MKKTKTILSIVALMGLTATSQAATILPIVESGTWFDTGTDLSNEAVTVFGSSGNASINASGGFVSLFVVDTSVLGTITGGTLDFTKINGSGAGTADALVVDFLGTTADNDFDAAEGNVFAQQTTGVTNLFNQVVADGTPISISLTAADITGGGNQFAVYRFSDPTLVGSNQQSAVSGFVLDAVVVPEPSSTALLGLGGLALVLRRRK